MRFYLIIIWLFASSCAYKNEKADLIIHNARIYTCNSNFDVEQAMAIKDGKVIETGPERQILNKYKSDLIIDNKLKPVYPWFVGSKNPIQDFIHLEKEKSDTQTDRKELLLMLTLWKAREEFIEEESGSLEKNKKANFFITDADLYTVPVDKLYNIHISSSYIDGVKTKTKDN